MNENNSREWKGSSLLDFPDDYTVIDLETTGCSSLYDSILEVSAIRVRNGETVASIQSFVNEESPVVFDYITELTGITQDMIDTAPDIESVLPRFVKFIGDDIVVGHNVGFDINFLYDRCMDLLSEPFRNDYVDTLRLSRRLNPELEHHRLADMADAYEISREGAHRALRDCEITNRLLIRLKEKAAEDYGSLQQFQHQQKLHGRWIHAADIKGDESKYDPDNDLYEKVCVITGTLEKMTRAQALQAIADIGAIPADSVTKKTNYLILGNYDSCKSVKNGKSSKQKKAEDLLVKGYDIQIIPESTFYEMLGI